MVTQFGKPKSSVEQVISWDPLPEDFQLEDEPVENTSGPILAGALRESLELAGFIQPQMLIASNFALCATLVFFARRILVFPKPTRRVQRKYLQFIIHF